MPVRITHPFHPGCGRELEVVFRRSHWGEERVFYRDRPGYLASIPARWTSAQPEDPFLLTSAGRSWFRVDDLIELAGLIQGLGS